MFPLFSLFQRKKVVSKAVPPAHPPAPVVPEGFFRPETADVLLATPLRQKLLEHIWQRTSVSRAQFCFLYLAPIRRFAELVQSFPASESHHHAYPGGMLDHGLEAAAHALKLRQSHLLPVGAPPEEQAAQSEAWTAGAACAALMHDVGKVAVDLHVEFADGTLWHPWHGALRQPYRFRYRKAREYRLHEAAGGWLAARLFEAGILDWLCGYPDLWRALLYVWAGQYEHAGLLGELVIQADRASVAQAMGGDPGKALAAPRHALQGKLLDGLRYLLKTELKLNRPGPSDGWLTREALWLVSKTVSDKLRAHLLSQGIEGIPSNNTALFDVLQEHSIAQATPEGKAIWKATVTSDAGWSHPFTLLKLPPSLIWENDARPEPFAGTVTAVREDEEDGEEEKGEKDISGARPQRGSPAKENVPNGNGIPEEEEEENAGAFLDVPWADESPDEAEIGEMPTENRPFVKPVNPMPSIVPAAAPSEPETKPSGEHFMTWLRWRIRERTLIINDARALVHTVADTAFLVSPGLFQRYVQEHPGVAVRAKQEEMADWQWIQKRFEKLGVHRKQDNGLNIWTCKVTGPRKSRRVHGYLLERPESLFDERPPDNPFLILLGATMDVAGGVKEFRPT